LKNKTIESVEANRKIIGPLIKGDIFCFDAIYAEYNKRIYSFALSFLKNREDSEGIVQEVFLTLWRKRADIKINQDIGSYLFSITYNTIRKHFRKLARERKHLKEFSKTVLTEDDSTNSKIEYSNLLEIAESAIELLPSRQKTIYHYSMRDGLSTKEIADKLDISTRTVENHLYRAKSQLKKTMLDNSLTSLLFFCLFLQ
jgi:RNA polymerase sigma-70 factor (ECF subfamily)